MARGTGYDSATLLSVGEFTKEQRRRLEAVTAASHLRGMSAPVPEVLAIAMFIDTGRRNP